VSQIEATNERRERRSPGGSVRLRQPMREEREESSQWCQIGTANERRERRSLGG
jgi:hypothetical protein